MESGGRGEAEVGDETVERLRECVEEGLLISLAEGGVEFLLGDVAVPKDKMCRCPWVVKKPSSKGKEHATLAALVFVVQYPSGNTWSQYTAASNEAGVSGLPLWSWNRAKRYFGLVRSTSSKEPRGWSPPRRAARSSPSRRPISVSPHSLTTSMSKPAPEETDISSVTSATSGRSSAATPYVTSELSPGGGQVRAAQDACGDGESDENEVDLKAPGDAVGFGAASASASGAGSGIAGGIGYYSGDVVKETSAEDVENTGHEAVGAVSSCSLHCIQRGLVAVQEARSHPIVHVCVDSTGAVESRAVPGGGGGDEDDVGDSFVNDFVGEGRPDAAAAAGCPSLGTFPFTPSLNVIHTAPPPATNHVHYVGGDPDPTRDNQVMMAQTLSRRLLPPPPPCLSRLPAPWAANSYRPSVSTSFSQSQFAALTVTPTSTSTTATIRDPAEAVAVAMTNAAVDAATGGARDAELGDTDSAQSTTTTRDFARRQEEACRIAEDAAAEAVLVLSASPPLSPPPTPAAPPPSPVLRKPFSEASCEGPSDGNAPRSVGPGSLQRDLQEPSECFDARRRSPSEVGGSSASVPASVLPRKQAEVLSAMQDSTETNGGVVGEEGDELRGGTVGTTQDAVMQLGAIVCTRTGRLGTVRFCGETEFITGTCLGIELHGRGGNNDGSHLLRRYFTCPPGRGLFVQADTVELVSKARGAAAEGGEIGVGDAEPDAGGVLDPGTAAEPGLSGDGRVEILSSNLRRRTAPSSFPRDAADSPNREVYENSRFLNAEKRSPLSPRNSLNSADGRPCPEVLTAFKQSGWGKIDVQSVLAMERREGKEEAAKSLVGVEKVLLEHGSDRENIVEDGAAVDAHDTEVHETDHRQPFGDNTSVDGRYILELTFSPSMTAPDLTHATVDDYAMMLTSSHDGKESETMAGEAGGVGATTAPLQKLSEQQQRASMSLATAWSSRMGEGATLEDGDDRNAEPTRRPDIRHLSSEASEAVDRLGEMESVRLLSPSTTSPPKTGAYAATSALSRGMAISRPASPDGCLSEDTTGLSGTEAAVLASPRFVKPQILDESETMSPIHPTPRPSRPAETSEGSGPALSGEPEGAEHVAAFTDLIRGDGSAAAAETQQTLPGTTAVSGGDDRVTPKAAARPGVSRLCSANLRTRFAFNSPSALSAAEAAGEAAAATSAIENASPRLTSSRGREDDDAVSSSDVIPILSLSSRMPSGHSGVGSGSSGGEAKVAAVTTTSRSRRVASRNDGADPGETAPTGTSRSTEGPQLAEAAVPAHYTWTSENAARGSRGVSSAQLTSAVAVGSMSAETGAVCAKGLPAEAAIRKEGGLRIWKGWRARRCRVGGLLVVVVAGFVASAGNHTKKDFDRVVSGVGSAVYQSLSPVIGGVGRAADGVCHLFEKSPVRDPLVERTAGVLEALVDMTGWYGAIGWMWNELFDGFGGTGTSDSPISSGDTDGEHRPVFTEHLEPSSFPGGDLSAPGGDQTIAGVGSVPAEGNLLGIDRECSAVGMSGRGFGDGPDIQDEKAEVSVDEVVYSETEEKVEVGAIEWIAESSAASPQTALFPDRDEGAMVLGEGGESSADDALGLDAGEAQLADQVTIAKLATSLPPPADSSYTFEGEGLQAWFEDREDSAGDIADTIEKDAEALDTALLTDTLALAAATPYPPHFPAISTPLLTSPVFREDRRDNPSEDTELVQRGKDRFPNDAGSLWLRPEPDFLRENGSMVAVTFLTRCGERWRRPSSSEGCIPMPMALEHDTKNDLVLRERGIGGELMWRSHKSSVTTLKKAFWRTFLPGHPQPPEACANVYLSARPDQQLVLLFPDRSARDGGISADYGMVVGFGENSDSVKRAAGRKDQHVAMLAPGGHLCVFSRGGVVRWVSRGVNRWSSYTHPRGSSLDD